MEGIDKYEYLKSAEAKGKGIRHMLYQALINGETLENKNGMFFRENRISQPEGLFQIEFGQIIPEVLPIYHEINPDIDVKAGDKIIEIHLKALTAWTNPNNKSLRELFREGIKRLKDYIKSIPIDQRPKHFIMYSHLANYAKIMSQGAVQRVHNVPEHIREESGSTPFFDTNVQRQRKEYLERFKSQKANDLFKNKEEEKEEEKWTKIEERYLEIPNKYSPDDIKLIVEPIEHLLNITDNYFEQLKKPSEESSQ